MRGLRATFALAALLAGAPTLGDDLSAEAVQETAEVVAPSTEVARSPSDTGKNKRKKKKGGEEDEEDFV